MSNESIFKRMLEVCDKFESRRLSILELGQGLSAHALGLENLERQLNEFIVTIDSRCEEISMDTLPRRQYEQGMILVSELKAILASYNKA